MTFSKYNKGRPFLIVTQHSTPSKKEKGKWVIKEQIIISDNIPNKFIDSAVVIIDIFKARFVKNRASSISNISSEKIMNHYMKIYSKEIEKGIENWIRNYKGNAEELRSDIKGLSEEIKTEIERMEFERMEFEEAKDLS